jgi:hypothetical protein
LLKKLLYNKFKKKIEQNNNENNRKNKITKFKFRNLTGCIRKIKIINFPSLPPIILKENSSKEIRKIKQK